jgi:hypothetical protein
MNQSATSEAAPQPVSAQSEAPRANNAQGNKGSPYKTIAWAVILLGFGVFMLLDPTMMEGAVAEGRRRGLLNLLIMIWGVPGSIGCIALGGFLAYRAYSSLKGGSSVSSTNVASATPPKLALAKPSLPAKRTSEFASKVAPSKRELEARAAKRRAQRAKTQGGLKQQPVSAESEVEEQIAQPV